MDRTLSSPIDRRRFLQGAGLAVAGTTAVMLRPGGELVGLLDRLFRFRRVAAEDLTRDVLEGLEGAAVAVELPDGGSVSLRVREITPIEPYASEGGAQGVTYSLLLDGPAARPVPQETYTFWSAGIGSFPLFVVPVGPVDEGGERTYEAVFNRLR